MTHGARRKLATSGLLMAAIAALAGCGGTKTAATNAVEMRDMEVVDGTVNDAMTDLDAVSASGTGIGNNVGNASTAKRTASATEETAGDAEAVASE